MSQLHHDIFTKIIQKSSTLILNKPHNTLKATWFDTRLGPMITISSDKELFLLEFMDKHNLEYNISKLQFKTNSIIIHATSEIHQLIELEIQNYFEAKLEKFKTPISLIGTSFQKLVWQELMDIPYGQTRSYKQQSTLIGKQKAFRAVANANGSNQIAIVIPCHRVIQSNGTLGGYNAGITRKQWLLEHEKLSIQQLKNF